ncbi:MAG TPA: type II toxin-antitoxin system HicB family antitoxin [Ktedonobacterales bacterium]|jgi:predicted RNase H-like HicB family nuclease|nr:type II toxin-antitoxin system HicB family antitoxin [Ktedonobacterales bacterium]
MSESPHYAMVIEWSDEDQAYVVSFPEWDATGLYFVHTHGESYEQAVKNGQDVLAELVAMTQAQGKPLPEPRRYAAAVL